MNHASNFVSRTTLIEISVKLINIKMRASTVSQIASVVWVKRGNRAEWEKLHKQFNPK